MTDPAAGRRVFDPAGPAVFLTELQGLFATFDQDVDDAAWAHFAFPAAADWITAWLELAREDLPEHPPAPHLTSQHTQGSA